MSSNNIENLYQLTPERAERMMLLELQTKQIELRQLELQKELELQNSIRQTKQIELETKQKELPTKQIEHQTNQRELQQFNSKSNETIEYR